MPTFPKLAAGGLIFYCFDSGQLVDLGHGPAIGPENSVLGLPNFDECGCYFLVFDGGRGDFFKTLGAAVS